MSLELALNNALSGLRYTSVASNVVSSNIANASNPDYVKRTVNAREVLNNQIAAGVPLATILRQLDVTVLRQLRSETSGLAYANQRADYLARLDNTFGTPGGANSLDSLVNAFASAAQSLSTSPENSLSRSTLVQKASALAQGLNRMAENVQALRNDAETAIGASVTQLNSYLADIQKLNGQISGIDDSNPSRAVLMDRRDGLLNKIAELVPIRTEEDKQSVVKIFLPNGTQLLAGGASELDYDPHPPLTPDAQYNTDPAFRKTSTISLKGAKAGADLIASGALSGGKLGALIEMRDKTLVDAQRRLDELASAMSSALSDKKVDSTAIAGGKTIDLTGLQPGNKVSMEVVVGGVTKKVTFVNIADPTVTLPSDLTADPNDTVVKVNFADTPANIKAAIEGALGTDFTATMTPPNLSIQVGGTSALNSMSANVTMTALTSGNVALPLFVDNRASNGVFTGNVTATSVQRTGFANRIAINPALEADPTSLAVYGTGVSAGDPARANFIRDQLSKTTFNYSAPAAGGKITMNYSGTIQQFTQQIMAQQASETSTANNLKSGQTQLVKALQSRMDETSGVNIDEEMSNLVVIQNSYGANARVMSAIRDMLNELIQIVK